jgi:hypothetical protein
MLPLEIDILCPVSQFPGSFEHEHDPLVADLGVISVERSAASVATVRDLSVFKNNPNI